MDNKYECEIWIFVYRFNIFIDELYIKIMVKTMKRGGEYGKRPV